MDVLVSKLNKSIAEIKEISDEVASVIKMNIAALESLEEQVSDYKTSLEVMKKAHGDAKDQTSRDLISYSTQIDELKAEVKRLEHEISGYISKKGELKLENVQLSEENRKFREYEAKAMKVLQAKEASLLERQDAIEQKENLNPKLRTLLPPNE